MAHFISRPDHKGNIKNLHGNRMCTLLQNNGMSIMSWVNLTVQRSDLLYTVRKTTGYHINGYNNDGDHLWTYHSNGYSNGTTMYGSKDGGSAFISPCPQSINDYRDVAT